MLLNFVDLKQKEVINIVDGKKLGYPEDFIFDSENTKIKSFTIPTQTKAFSFKKSEPKTVNLDDIFLIGQDVILVNLPTMAVKTVQEQPPENLSLINNKNSSVRINPVREVGSQVPNGTDFVYFPKQFRKVQKQNEK